MTNETPVAVMYRIAEERRQDAKWGEQNHHPLFWLGIIGEEYGELSKAAIEWTARHEAEFAASWRHEPFTRAADTLLEQMEGEAVQLAACCVAFLEFLSRPKERAALWFPGGELHRQEKGQ